MSDGQLEERVTILEEKVQQHFDKSARMETKILGYEGNPNGSILGDVIKLKSGVVWKDQLEGTVEKIVKEEFEKVKARGRSTASKVREYAQTGLAIAALVGILLAIAGVKVPW